MPEKPKAPPKLKSIKSIQKYLATQDKRLGRFLENAPLYPVAKEPAHNSHFETIVFAVIGQQLSGKAADTITHRLIAKTGSPVKPAKILKLGHLQLREVGLSNAKARTILELSEAVVKGFDLESVDELPDDEIVKQLTQFWGIGRWTVEMFLIFHLGRLDVWPVDDLAVRRGWDNVHGNSEPIKAKVLKELGEPFAGMRSVVAWYCWRAS